MKTKSENLKDNKVKVTVNFDKDEVSQAISNKYRELASKYKFPGFRKGKAPRPVVDSLFGEDGVLVQVTDDLVNNNYPLSLDAEYLFPTAKADFGKDDTKLVEQGKPYSFSYTVEVEPSFELSSDSPAKIELPPICATKEEIDAQINQFREHYFTYVDAKPNEKAKSDSTVSLDIEAKDDNGNKIDSLTNKALNYHLGSKFLPDDFEKKIVGLKKDDKLSFVMKMPKEPSVYTTSLQDKTKNISFKLKVNSIQKKEYPKVDDAWAKKNMGFDTVKEMREKIKEQIVNEKERMQSILKENKCLDFLAKRIKEEAPKANIERKEAELMQDFFTQLQQNGMTFDQYLQRQGISSDKFKEDLKKQAADVAKQDMALDAYAKLKGIKATQAEVEEEFKHGDPKNWKNLYNEWVKRGELRIVKRAIVRMKAAKDLVKNAQVKEQINAKKSSTKKSNEK